MIGPIGCALRSAGNGTVQVRSPAFLGGWVIRSRKRIVANHLPAPPSLLRALSTSRTLFPWQSCHRVSRKCAQGAFRLPILWGANRMRPNEFESDDAVVDQLVHALRSTVSYGTLHPSRWRTSTRLRLRKRSSTSSYPFSNRSRLTNASRISAKLRNSTR
jgi:hypothetical protein